MKENPIQGQPLSPDNINQLLFLGAQYKLSSLSGKDTLRITHLRSFLEAYLNLSEQTKDGNLRIPCSSGYAELSPKECTRMISTVLSLYIQEWGCNSQNLHQKLSTFVQVPFSHPKDSTKPMVPSRSSTLLKQLHRIEKKYLPMLELRKQQLEKAYPDKNCSITQEPNNKAYNILSLAWIHHFYNGHLRYHELLYDKKEFLNVAHEKKPYAALADACEKYHDGLIRIEALYAPMGDLRWGNMSSVQITAQLREYVSLCLLTIWLERACHFQLASEIAAYLTSRNPKDISHDPLMAQALWYPALYPKENILSSPQKSEKTDSRDCVIDTPLDILSYPQQIPYVLGTAPGDIAKYYNKEVMMREKMLELSVILEAACPSKEQHRWTRAQLQNIADFFHNDYPVVASYAKCTYPRYEDPFYPLPVGFQRRQQNPNANLFYRNLFDIFMYTLQKKNVPLFSARNYLHSKLEQET